MAQQTLNVGTAPNDGTGDTLRAASIKTNSNFDEIYTSLGGSAQFTRTGTGAVARSYTAALRDSLINVKDFGAVGDGVTNDSTAITNAQAAATAAGTGLYFPPGNYGVVSGLAITAGAVNWVGAPGGLSRLVRVGATNGSPVIALGGSTCTAVNLRDLRFDFAKASYAGQSNTGMSLTADVLFVDIEGCRFSNAVGANGNGLHIIGNCNSSTGVFATGFYVIRDCEFTGNDQSGLFVESADRVLVEACRAWSNSGNGIRLDVVDSTLVRTVQRSIVSNCICWTNSIAGIQIGNFNVSNVTSPTLWGVTNPDARGIIVDSCMCYDNAVGIAAFNDFIRVANCHCEQNTSAQMEIAGRDCTVSGGTYDATGETNSFTIRSYTAQRTTFEGLRVKGGTVGLGGMFLDCTITGCTFTDSSSSLVSLRPFGRDNSDVAFQGIGSNCVVRNSQFYLHNDSVRGVEIVWGYANASIVDNDFWQIGTAQESIAVANAVQAATDHYTCRDNRYNGFVQRTATPSSGNMTIPDIIQDAHITASLTAAAITGNLRTSSHNSNFQKVTWVRVSHRGQGGATPFTSTLPTSVTFTGGGGSGATAVPHFDQEGYMVGVRITAGGSGYTSAPTASVTGTGGASCTFTVGVGTPIPNGHRLMITALNGCDITVPNTAPTINGFRVGATALRVPPGCTIRLYGKYNNWYLDDGSEDHFYGTEFRTLATLNNQLTAATIVAGGTGYTVGDTLTLTGGGGATLRVRTVSSGVITAVSLSNQGDIASAPVNPVAVTGGTGTGATFNLTWAAVAHVMGDRSSELACTPAGTIAAATVTMPPNPADGQRIEINSTQIITTLTVQANTGHTLTGAATTLAANSSVAWRFRLSNNTWRRCS